MDADTRARRLEALRVDQHGDCYVCGRGREQGLRLSFHPSADGGVEGCFSCAETFRGYPQQLHGGIICAILDGAMTNCLFANGWTAVTAEMTVRFLRPVMIGRTALVRARVLAAGARLFRLEAQMLQDGATAARATAKFVINRRQPPHARLATADADRGESLR
jgi:uncharacterized protein (TIGR00369 family)